MSEQEWNGMPPFMAQATLVEQAAQSLRGARRLSSAGITQPTEPLGAWDLLTASVSLLDRSGQSTFVAVSGGQEARIEPPGDIWGFFRELRRVMYVDGSGTWFTAEVEVPRDGPAVARFDYDAEPDWQVPPGAREYVQDFKRFPRDAEHTPAWLADRLAEGTALATGRFGPQVWFGVRFQASFAPGGVEAAYDPHPSPQAQQWAQQVVERLAGRGVVARTGRDVDEEFVEADDDATPEDWQVWFPTVVVPVGRGQDGSQGYCQVSFWTGQVGWSVDVWEHQADRATAQQTLTAVREVVSDVTGWPVVESQVSDGYTHVMVGLGPVA